MYFNYDTKLKLIVFFNTPSRYILVNDFVYYACVISHFLNTFLINYNCFVTRE